jgi:hypothetical protein
VRPFLLGLLLLLTAVAPREHAYGQKGDDEYADPEAATKSEERAEFYAKDLMDTLQQISQLIADQVNGAQTTHDGYGNTVSIREMICSRTSWAERAKNDLSKELDTAKKLQPEVKRAEDAYDAARKHGDAFTINMADKDLENALAEAEKKLRARVYAKAGLVIHDEASPAECPTLPKLEPSTPKEVRPTDQVMVMLPRPRPTELGIPALPLASKDSVTPGTIVVSTNSTTYCTFSDGTSMEVAYTPADDNGNATASVAYADTTVTPGTTATPGGETTPRGTPQTPGTPAMTDKMPTPGTPPITNNTPTPGTPPTTDSPPTPTTATTDNPPPITDNTPTPTTTTTDNPPPANTSEQPPTTDQTPTPTTPMTDITPTPTLHVTIYIKASQAVLEGGQTGEPIEGQIVKLVLKDKPVVPSTEERKTADDRGFNRPSPQDTTGADGQAKIDMTSEELLLFTRSNQLPTIAGKPVNNFRIDVNLMKHNGGVVETTGRTLPDLKGGAIGANVLVEPVQIGDRTWWRIGVNTPYGKTDDLVEKLSKLFGVPVEIDICVIKEPGPPLGRVPASYGALNHELPQTSVKLRKSARVMTSVP